MILFIRPIFSEITPVRLGPSLVFRRRIFGDCWCSMFFRLDALLVTNKCTLYHQIFSFLVPWLCTAITRTAVNSRFIEIKSEFAKFIQHRNWHTILGMVYTKEWSAVRDSAVFWTSMRLRGNWEIFIKLPAVDRTYDTSCHFLLHIKNNCNHSHRELQNDAQW